MDVGTLIAGRFEIVGQAGRGGMASVHRAIDHDNDGYAAVKVLHLTMEDAGERVRGEAEVLARLEHPGIVGHVSHTGRAPFRGEDLVGVLAKILFQETPRVRSERPDVPAELDAVLAKAMAKEPGERFADMSALSRALRKVQQRLTGLDGSSSR